MAGLRSLILQLLVPTAAAATTSPKFRHQKPRSLEVLEGNLTTRGLSHKGITGSKRLHNLLVAFGVGGTLLGSKEKPMAVSESISGDKVREEEGVGATLPDLMTEFMVNMTCEGCVKSVRSKVEPLEGVKSVDVDLVNQVVRILGSASVKSLTTAIEQSGRDVRLIGQGIPSDFTPSAAVAEFKGPEIHGVVRFAQVSMQMSRIEANFSGLTPGSHKWSINMYGDLTRGAASTGGIYKSESTASSFSSDEPIGDLGVLEVGSDGATEFTGTKMGLRVFDLIGRAVVIYEGEDNLKDGISAAVIARSAGVGQNYKKLCTCDGTVIWESTHSDFVKPNL